MIVKNTTSEILLTFDDGPTSHLPELLAILNAEKVQGLFFWLSDLARDGVNCRAVIEEGHEIGIHGSTHDMLNKLTYDEQQEQLSKAKAALESTVGRGVHWFRPPYGLYNKDTKEIGKKLGLDLVLWGVASWDWKHEKDEEMIVENVVSHVKPGDIILLHELPQTVKILPRLISMLRSQGFSLSQPFSPIVLQTT